MIGKFGFTTADTEDLHQDFRLDLIQRLNSFNPDRAARRTFISRIITHKARTLVEDRKTRKRDFTKRAFSLDDEVNLGDQSYTRMELQERADYLHGIFGQFISCTPDHVSHFTIFTFISQLPSGHRCVCEGLSRGDRVVEIARDLNIKRATVYRRIDEICHRLVEAGFGLENRCDTF